MSSLHRPPTGYLSALRRLTEIPSLALGFDDEDAAEHDRPAWKVMAMTGSGYVMVCDWPHALDGNLDALAAKIARHDYLRNGGLKKHGQALMARWEAKQTARRNRFRDQVRGIADYSRNAFRKLAYGEEKIGG